MALWVGLSLVGKVRRAHSKNYGMGLWFPLVLLSSSFTLPSWKEGSDGSGRSFAPFHRHSAYDHKEPRHEEITKDPSHKWPKTIDGGKERPEVGLDGGVKDEGDQEIHESLGNVNC